MWLLAWERDRAGVSRVGKHPHGAEHGAHKLFRPYNPVPIPADGAERIVCRQAQIMGLFHLLQ